VADGYGGQTPAAKADNDNGVASLRVCVLRTKLSDRDLREKSDYSCGSNRLCLALIEKDY